MSHSLLLRASSEMSGAKVDLHAIVDGEDVAARSGVAHAAELVAFAEALVGGDDDALARARERVLAAVGPEGLVDTAAVASNFERMVRIADGTGIPLDGRVVALSADLRDELDLARFPSAANTPGTGLAARALGALVRPAARGALRIGGWLRGRPSRAWGVATSGLRVECRVEEGEGRVPVRFGFGRRMRDVAELLDRWDGDDHRYFRVRTEDGATWVLRWDAPSDSWQLAFYQDGVADGSAG